MSFSTVQDQWNAIVQQNGKQLWFKGPRLLVQRYVSETGLPGEGGSGNNLSFGNAAQRFFSSKADMLHKKGWKRRGTATTGWVLHLRIVI